MNRPLGFPNGFFINDNSPASAIYYRNFNQTSGWEPYTSVADVRFQVVSGLRYKGLTVNVNGVEYWFKDGIADGDLILKVQSASTSLTRITVAQLNALASFSLTTIYLCTDALNDDEDTLQVLLTAADASNLNEGAFDMTSGLIGTFDLALGLFTANASGGPPSGPAGGELAGTYPNPTLLNAAVIAKVLTGLSVSGSTITATDTILQAFGKAQNQINALVGGVNYQGTWNATTNSPTLVSSTGTKGYYYVVSVAGSTNLDGITSWALGDWAIFNGAAWQKVDNTDAVISVNGQTGIVALTTADVSEVTNLYFTAARVLATLLTGYVSGAGTVAATDTILEAIQKLNGNIAAKVSKSGDNMTGALLLAQSTSIASAATVDLATATGNAVTITGSTGPIGSLGTLQAGATFILTFASTPTITHSSAIQLPGGVDVVCQAGDKALAVSNGSGNWSLLFFARATGLPLVSQYLTVSLATWNALVAASSLVGGINYRVTSAYTFDFYGAKDIIVVADSVNTVQSTGWVVFADYFVPYQVDASLSNPGVFFDCVQAMALDPDALYDYITGSPNWKFNAGLPIFFIGTDGLLYGAQISNDPATIALKNVKCLDGFNLGLLGTFTPETAAAAADDFFTPSPYSVQIRLELTAAEVGSATSIDIPGLHGVTDYFWDATDVRIANTFVTTPYTNTLFIQSASAADPQWSDGGVLQAVSSQFKGMTDLKSAPAADNVFADGGKLRVTKSGADVGGGDGTVVLFITAQLVKTIA